MKVTRAMLAYALDRTGFPARAMPSLIGGMLRNLPDRCEDVTHESVRDAFRWLPRQVDERDIAFIAGFLRAQSRNPSEWLTEESSDEEPVLHLAPHSVTIHLSALVGSEAIADEVRKAITDEFVRLVGTANVLHTEGKETR